MNHTAPAYRVERWAQTAGWVVVGDFSTPETARAACPDRSFRVTPLSGTGVEHIPSGVSLAKPSDCPGFTESEARLASRRTDRRRSPWYPLDGHREGLRMNDLFTLQSAFSILGYVGATAYTMVDGMARRNR